MSQYESGELREPIRLSVTSETENIARVRTVVEETARRMGFGENDASAVALAIDEAVANVIRHGYEGRPGQPIDVTIERVRRDGGPGLQVTICDCCPQVDPAEIAGRDLDDIRPGGLGTHIMKTVMDEVEYTPRQPEGMQLRMVKMLADSVVAGNERAASAREEPPDGHG